MIIRNDTELSEMLIKLDNADVYCLDTETVDMGIFNLYLVGLSIGLETGETYYIPTGHSTGSQLPADYVLEKLKPILENSQKTGVFHNAKYDLKVLENLGGIRLFDAGSSIYDTMIAAWLTDTEREVGLKKLSKSLLGYEMVELSEIAKKEKDKRTGDMIFRPDLVDITTLGKYAEDDVKIPLQLKEIFDKQLEEMNLQKVFWDLEIPTIEMLMEMENFGVKIDKDLLDRFLEESPKKIEEVENKIFQCRPSGEPFNPRSNPQLNKVLFQEIGIKPLGQLGKSGYYSTKEEYLEIWANQYEICRLLLELRQLDKLRGTYLEGIEKRLDPDGRIRSMFNQCIATGRFSSKNPNLQNCPRPENDVYGIRDLFCAEEGMSLVVADYSQIELRVLAHFSKDKKLVEVFNAGEDIHSLTAKELFDLTCEVSEVKEKYPEQRSIAKNYNFAMVYGAGVKKLAAMTGTSEEKAAELRDKYFSSFPGIAQYQKRMKKMSQDKGYVKTITGRYRHVRDAQLPADGQRNIALKEGAYRRAGNSPIQGSAADIIKVAMRNIRNRLRKEEIPKDKARILLQVHDEMMLEAEDSITNYISKVVQEEMENAVKIAVPIDADVGIGKIWSKAKG